MAVIVLLLVVLSSLGSWMTSTMVGHVLIQIPLLIATGFALGSRLEVPLTRFLDRWNAVGIPGTLLVVITLAFWMIPRWLDAALTNSAIAWAKYGSLVMFCGLPLALSWSRLHPIARGVFKIELLSMLFRLGWLYLISPERLCNNYLLTDQIWLGRGMIMIAMALSITWLIPVFFAEFATERAHSIEIMRPPKG